MYVYVCMYVYMYVYIYIYIYIYVFGHYVPAPETPCHVPAWLQCIQFS